jgi:hypothetical protein
MSLSDPTNLQDSIIDKTPCLDLSWWPDYYKGERDDIAAAHAVVQRVVDELGPFDGVIAYSQGATLAFDILLRYAMESKEVEKKLACPFQCAVLIGGGRSYDFWTTEAQTTLKMVDAHELGVVIRQPTLIVVGDDDDFPVMNEYHYMRDFWKESPCNLFVYKGHHGLPTDSHTNSALAAEIKKLMSSVENLA